MVGVHLERIENDCEITRRNNGEFLYEYQKALLLSLLELGRLTQEQFRYAAEKLRQQRTNYEKNYRTFFK